MNKIKLFAFDLDGTLYLGDNAIAGAVDLIRYLREKYQVVFFTNNSAKTVGQVHEKLNRLELECKLDEVYTSSSTTAAYLSEARIDNVFVVGSRGLCTELENKGIRIIDSDLAENLVVGLDPDFNYNKIAIAMSILQKGGKFIICNEDRSFPVGENRFRPGCGAMVGAISAVADKRPDFIVGKPNTYILSKISEAFGVNNNDIMVVGDSYESDVQMALNYNCKAILIANKNVDNDGVVAVKNLKELLQYIRREK